MGEEMYIWGLSLNLKPLSSSTTGKGKKMCFYLFANSNIILVFEITVLGPQFPVGKENSQPMCCSGNSLFPELLPFMLSVGGNDQCID